MTKPIAPETGRQPVAPTGPDRRVTAGVFALALALRVLFWQATPDAGWVGSAWYKGDAATWLRWAEALRNAVPFEGGLPIRPPGAAYLIAALWNGDSAGIATVKLVWCLIGALTAALFYVAAARSTDRRIAAWVGFACAASSGLMVLSTSLNNETPYLLLVAATLALWPSLWRRPGALVICAWTALHAIACLFRAEHLLYFALLLGLLIWRWARAGSRSEWRSAAFRAALALATFAVLLTPWHLTAWDRIERFNHGPVELEPGAEEAQARIERLVSFVRWSPDALAGLERLPAATRPTSRLFIAATEGVRGRSEVGPESLKILDAAFGYTPEPLTAHPYLALYGPLNFHLANHAGNRHGGFDRGPLDRRPPLVGGMERYPIALVAPLPPVRLTLSYPPHLQAINHGYRLGWEWIRRSPKAAAALAVRKWRRFWEGATLGVGGYGAPLGLSGVRRPVDLVVPEVSAPVLAWQVLIGALTLVGLWIARHDPALVPWSLFLLTRWAIVTLFFGYARQGATVIPVVALFSGLAVAQFFSRRQRRRKSGRRPVLGRIAWIAIGLLLAAEAYRWQRGPEVSIDGRAIRTVDIEPPDDHGGRRIEVR